MRYRWLLLIILSLVLVVCGVMLWPLQQQLNRVRANISIADFKVKHDREELLKKRLQEKDMHKEILENKVMLERLQNSMRYWHNQEVLLETIKRSGLLLESLQLSPSVAIGAWYGQPLILNLSGKLPAFILLLSQLQSLPNLLYVTKITVQAHKHEQRYQLNLTLVYHEKK